jgi:hypothetical protein
MSTINAGRRPNRSDRRNLRLKLRCQRANAKNQNKKIKRIQRPPQKTGNKRIPLHRRKPPKMPNEFHEALSSFVNLSVLCG